MPVTSLRCLISSFAPLFAVDWSFDIEAELEYFPGGSDGKEFACNARDPGLIPGSERSLGEGIATHSNILVWRIPWTEEPGGLQSMGSKRVRHD